VRLVTALIYDVAGAAPSLTRIELLRGRAATTIVSETRWRTRSCPQRWRGHVQGRAWHAIGHTTTRPNCR